MSAKRARRERRAAARSDQRTSVSRSGPRHDANRWLIPLLLVALVAIVFAPVRGFEFTTLDDPQYVSANPMVLNGLTADGIRWAFAFGSSFYWHPLTWLSHMFDVSAFGVRPGAHHVMNVFLHSASAVVLYLASSKMTRRAWLSAFVAALFAIHPLHVESVAWVAERKDVLSTFFLMWALLSYAQYVERPSPRRRLLVALLFLLGLLAKPMIATFPFLLLVLDYWPLARWNRGWIALVIEKLELFILSALSVFVTIVSQRESSAVVALEGLSLSDRVANSLVSYVIYMRDMVWPARLAAFYPLLPPSHLFALLAAVILAVITIAVILLRRRMPFLLAGWLWYVGMLVPVIGIVQAGDQGRADRFTYVPLIGLFIAFTWLAFHVSERVKLPAIVLQTLGGALVIAFAFVSTRQVAYWRDDLSLWTRAASVTHDNYRAEDHLGVALTNRGQLEEGIRHYEASIRIWPQYPEGHNNLGAARMEQARYADAVNEFSAAVHAKPRDPGFRYNLAVALDAAGRRQDAIAQVEQGLRLAPSNGDLLKAADVFGMKRK